MNYPLKEGKRGGISLRPKGASSQNWTTIATILASKCHHCVAEPPPELKKLQLLYFMTKCQIWSLEFKVWKKPGLCMRI